MEGLRRKGLSGKKSVDRDMMILVVNKKIIILIFELVKVWIFF
jgi:hypothetical protein